MINTVTNLRKKSEAFVNTIKTCLGELKNTNNEITTQIQINEASVDQHNKDVEQLHKDNEELAVLRAENETLVSKVEDILGV